MKQRINGSRVNRTATSSRHPVILSSCHPLICFLLLFLTACNAAPSAALPGGTGTEEDAIEQFLANAPATSKEGVVGATPTHTAAGGLALPLVNPASFAGNVTVAGDGNLFPLTDQLYRRFVADGYPGSLSLEDVGTATGLHAFCRNDPAQPPVDIAATTRLLLAEELDRCLRLGRSPLALWVGMDALVIVVHSSNDFVQDVTMPEVTELFKAHRWSEVRSNWPRRGIVTVLPAQQSDALAMFAEVFFAGNLQLLLTTQDTFFTQDDVEAVQKILEIPDSIGVVNYTSYLQNRGLLRLVKIAGKTPDLATIQRGEWPLSRPLLLYSTAELLQNKPQVQGFLTYFLTHLNEEIIQAGKFPLKPADLDHSKLTLLIGTANEAWLADLREEKQ